ncbi:MAG: glutamine synthetase III [Tissierellia bacterium]|nr:glutamine synthetase III [Tissierellia bacterium]
MTRKTVPEFGTMTFNKDMMRERLPHQSYRKWKNAIRNNRDLDRETADVIAHAMKEWAIEHGATHYCHWFQPLNGRSAKKHDAFLDRTDRHEAIYRFSGKELIKGESDGSSFPSGGMRSTFEARGYTYWDATSNSFIIDRILYIPTIFVSFNGDKLDKKGPLIASMNLLSTMGSRIVNLFAKDEYTYRMKSKVGLEQEFFLIDRELYNQRSDLKSCGRTLIGAAAPKGQEMEDHYFGSIPQRVMNFYEEVNDKLWDLGIYIKTEHNEVAPCQFEIVALFENANISVDYNHLVMNTLVETAPKYGLVCLLHEKPFAGVSGSGKHNNYSLSTNYGLNVFDPGTDPENNPIFLLFTAAMVAAVDDYAPLLRLFSSGPSNDCRLGGQEAPPAIISIFLGRDVEDLFMNLAHEDYEKAPVESGSFKINSLGYTPRDTSDRNRTSPFAFTGNKFEFRMLGSSVSPADANTVMNTILAGALDGIYEELLPFKDDDEALMKKAKEVAASLFKAHERILYNKDNYSQEWVEEARRRGLPEIPTYYDAVQYLRNEGCTKIFKDYGIYNDNELEAIYEIELERVVNIHSLETRALITMLTKDVEPAVVAEIQDLLPITRELEIPSVRKKLESLTILLEELMERHHKLQLDYQQALPLPIEEKVRIFQDEIRPSFDDIRKIADALEAMVSRKNWTIPTYEDIFTALDN